MKTTLQDNMASGFCMEIFGTKMCGGFLLESASSKVNKLARSVCDKKHDILLWKRVFF
jgi:hypothetical protein